MNNTGIKWTEKTWNPVTGCQQVSTGCKFCYAKRIAEDPSKAASFPNGFGLALHEKRLTHPMYLPEPSLIFVNSMSDLFWDMVPEDFVDKVMAVIRKTPQHRYQILTKRPDRMAEYSRRKPLPENVWAGTSIENQAAAHRLDELRKVQGARIKFISAEPLLGPLDLDWSALDWVIVGGESGPHLHKPDVCAQRGLAEFNTILNRWAPRGDDRKDWVRGIRDGCAVANTAFFFKQWGGPWSGSAGNDLDGMTHENYPTSLLAMPPLPLATAPAPTSQMKLADIDVPF